MYVYILGSGAGVLAGNRYFTSILVKTENSSVLLDAGPPIFKRLYELRIENALPKVVFLSHYHHDHVGGLFMYLYELEARYIKELPLIITNDSTAKLLKDALNIFVKTYLHPEIITVRDSSQEEIRLNDLKIELIPVKHSVPTHGILLRSTRESKSLFYSSDTLFMDNLNESLDSCDIGFHEASISIDMEDMAQAVGYHSSPRQALEAIRNCRVKGLIHISTQTFKKSFVYKEKFIIADDGLVLKL